ncbi:MAG: hypothetical protein QGG39_03015, partial [Candidatus Poribacteria bacterium]|nr:hypothetical protein [Candidatus Poribacteria bacterium]
MSKIKVNQIESQAGSNVTVNSQLILNTPLAIGQGGTGATSAALAASALGLGTEDSPTFTGLTVDAGEATLTFTNDAAGGNANLTIWRDDTSITNPNPLGYLSFAGSDATSSIKTAHATIYAIAEGSHSAGDNPTGLRFEVTPEGSSALTEKFSIAQSGAVTVTDGILTVNNTAATADEILLDVQNNGTSKFSVDEDGDVVVVGDSSLNLIDQNGNYIVNSATVNDSIGGHQASFSFDGTDDYVTVGANDKAKFPTQPEISVELWADLDASVSNHGLTYATGNLFLTIQAGVFSARNYNST